MVKDFPYVGFSDIATPERSARADQLERTADDLRQRAGRLIERARGGQALVTYKLSGALAWLLYRAADVLDKARF